MVRKWFVLVDRSGLMLGPARSVLVDYEIAGVVGFLAASTNRELLAGIDVSSLNISACWNALYRRKTPLKVNESVSSLRKADKAVFVIVAPLVEPATPRTPETTARDVAWLGLRRITSVGMGGVDLADTKTLLRRALVDNVTSLLEKKHAV